MLVKVMPRDKSIRHGWRCDSCGEFVPHVQAGWVEWLAAQDTKGKPKVSGLRLVHRRNTSPRQREPHACQYNPRDEFRKNRGIVEGLALDRFAGPDGFMLLFSMIAERELPARELIELAKRVQVPGLRSSVRIGPRCRQRRSNHAFYLVRLLLAVRDLARAKVGQIPNVSEDDPR
jgi:hypothetical protein